MAAETVRIEELVLRVPGLSRREAQHLGQEVAHHVADGLPPQIRPRHLRALDLRLAISVRTPRERIAKSITDAILERLV